MKKPTAQVGNAAQVIRTLGGRDVSCVGRDRWALLAAVAELQRNRINTRQLLTAGFSERMIATAVRREQLRQAFRGVYIVGADVPLELGAETAALLTAPGLVLVGISVLAALSLLTPDPSGPVHVAGTARSRAEITVHRYADLGKVRPVLGLPMTTVERALLDAADTLTGRPLEQAVDEALAARQTSRTKIREIAAQATGRRGQAELIELADARRPNAQTKRHLAELALQLIRAAGLPEPETEVAMLGFVMDFFFREAGLVVEVDPFSIHGVIRANFNRDRDKARACRQAGLEFISATGDDLTAQPLAFIRDVTQTIERRMIGKAA